MALIVHLSPSPVAGVPAILAKAITKHTPHESRSVTVTDTYGDGRVFPGDLHWGDPETEEVVRKADVLVIHQGLPGSLPGWFQTERAEVRLVAHSVLSHGNILQTREKFPGAPLGVIAQHVSPLCRKAGIRHAPLPNVVPLEDYEPLPGGLPFGVWFAPSIDTDVLSRKTDNFWNSKGCGRTALALLELSKKIKAEISDQKRLPFAESLKYRRKFPVHIDECVTGSYHRASLEACAMGAVAVNDISPEVEAVLREVSGAPGHPFFKLGIADLVSGLADLAEMKSLREAGLAGREWMEKWWNPKTLLERHWIPFLLGEKTRVVVKAERKTVLVPPPKADRRLEKVTGKVGVVITARSESAEWISRAAESVRAQKPDVIVVVYDVGEDPLRTGGARNAGIAALSEAGCEFIATLDADDWWLPGKLEKSLAAFEDPEVGWVYSDFEWHEDGKNRKTLKTRDWHPGADIQDGNPATVTNSVYRVAALKEARGFDRTWRQCEDLDLWVRLDELGWKGAHVAEPLFVYVKHGGNKTIVSHAEFAPETAAIRSASRVRRQMRAKR